MDTDTDSARGRGTLSPRDSGHGAPGGGAHKFFKIGTAELIGVWVSGILGNWDQGDWVNGYMGTGIMGKWALGDPGLNPL